MGLRCGRLQNIVPVSYTHLDVYKRQTICRSSKLNEFSAAPIVHMISDRLLPSENNTEPLRVFVTGGAGTGKTFTLKIIVEQIHRLSHLPASRAVTVAAPTGVAARLIGGSTLYSTFALAIEKAR